MAPHAALVARSAKYETVASAECSVEAVFMLDQLLMWLLLLLLLLLLLPPWSWCLHYAALRPEPGHVVAATICGSVMHCGN